MQSVRVTWYENKFLQSHQDQPNSVLTSPLRPFIVQFLFIWHFQRFVSPLIYFTFSYLGNSSSPVCLPCFSWPSKVPFQHHDTLLKPSFLLTLPTPLARTEPHRENNANFFTRLTIDNVACPRGEISLLHQIHREEHHISFQMRPYFGSKGTVPHTSQFLPSFYRSCSPCKRHLLVECRLPNWVTWIRIVRVSRFEKLRGWWPQAGKVSGSGIWLLTVCTQWCI